MVQTAIDDDAFKLDRGSEAEKSITSLKEIFEMTWPMTQQWRLSSIFDPATKVSRSCGN